MMQPICLQELVVPPFHLSVYLQEETPAITAAFWESLLTRLKMGLPFFFQRLIETEEAHLVACHLLMGSETSWEADISFCTNETIHRLNHTYREQDHPTDVLTFTLYAESSECHPNRVLPVKPLGEVFVSWQWASAHAATDTLFSGFGEPLGPEDRLAGYLLTRVFHGLLHLLGINHDTNEAYNKVVTIQNQVLYEIFQ